MKKEKISFKKILAYILILAGIVLVTLPFVKRSINNFNAKKDYEDFLKNSSKIKVEDMEKRAKKYNEDIKNSKNAMVDPFLDKNFDSQTILEERDEIFAYLSIPKLDKYLPIYLDASLDHIAMGVAQVSGTDIPIGGQSTRSVIAGHRDWWTDTMFLYVDDLIEGDKIFVERFGKKLEYEVYSKEVISPYDWDKLEPVEGEDILTLLTCHPFLPPRPDRLLVNARRVEEIPESYQNESDENISKNIENIEVSKKSKLVTNITYLVSALGILLFVFVFIRFIKYIGQK